MKSLSDVFLQIFVGLFAVVTIVFIVVQIDLDYERQIEVCLGEKILLYEGEMAPTKALDLCERIY